MHDSSNNKHAAPKLPLWLKQSVYMGFRFIFFRTARFEKMTELEDKVRIEAGKVQDPETGQTFEEMQMIQSVKETEPGTVTIEFVPTSPFCPIAFKLSADLRDAAKSVPGVKKVLVFCRGHAMEQQINEKTNKE
jgi:metal-sulfur cluster biosynthetic enzyme